MDFQVVEVKRGGVGYLAQNYLFRKDRERAGQLYLKCTESKQHCRARAKITEGQLEILYGVHNHDAPDVVEYLFRSSVKQEVTRVGNARVSVPQVFANARSKLLENLPLADRLETANRLPTFRTLRGSMEYARGGMLPPNPARRDLIDLNDFCRQNVNADGSSFLIADSGAGDEERILLFGSQSNLRALAAANEWYMDGTFWTVPYLFIQIFTIHAFILGRQFPLVYALLPDKTQRTYERMFRMLLREMANHGYILSLLTLVSDFESGLLAAVRGTFGRVLHRGCYFHFAQSINRKLQELGMAQRYQNDAEFKKSCRMLIALGFVPAADKHRFIQLLLGRYGGDGDFRRIVDNYVIPTWYLRFPLSLWDWYMVEVRTTNNVEAWHRRFNNFARQPDVGFYKFIFILKEVSDHCLIAIRQRENGEPLPRCNATYARLNERIMLLMREYEDRSNNPLDHFLAPLSYCVPAPVPNQ